MIDSDMDESPRRPKGRQIESFSDNSDDESSKAAKRRVKTSGKKVASSNNRESKSTEMRTESNGWRKDCEKLIQDLINHPDSSPFLSPVSITDYPDYLESVGTPIDLGTIRTRLLSNHYANDVKKFDADCKLLFKNSKTYNTDKRSKIYGMTLRLQALYESRIAKILFDHKNAINYESMMTSRYGRVRCVL